MVPEGFSPTRAFAQYVEALRRMAPVAQRHGVTIVVEPLNRGECNLINTIVEGAEAAAQADHPAVKLLVDIFHMLRNGESPDDIVTVVRGCAMRISPRTSTARPPGSRARISAPSCAPSIGSAMGAC